MKVHRVPLCFAAGLHLIQSVLKPRAVRITMFSNYNHFVQRGYGNFEDDDDDIESSQESEQSFQSSQSSEEMDSSGEEEEEHVDPWSRIQNEVCNRHEAQLEALINSMNKTETRLKWPALKLKMLCFQYIERN